MAKTQSQKKLPATPKIGDPRNVILVKPEDTPTFYANVVNVEASTHDIKLRFGQIQGASETELTVAQTVHVYLSYSHARAFVNVLNGVLSRAPLSAGFDSTAIDAGKVKPS
jgi:hypothetical protein